MTGRAKSEHENNKSSKTDGKNFFPNLVVAVLLLVGVLVSAAVIYEYHRLDKDVPADVLGEILGFAAAELGILAGRQVVGSDALKWFRKKTDDAAKSDAPDIFGGSI